MATHVVTVQGPVDADELGTTLPHEHLLIDLYRVFQPNREFLLNDVDLACHELQRFADAGGRTVVELTTPDMARDPAGLAEISRRTGVNIVMGTGRYREPFYEPDLWKMSTNDVRDLFVADIVDGSAGVRPGIIGEIGTHQPWVSPVEERVFRAAGRAHLETGLTVTLHAVASTVGLAQLDLLLKEGVPPHRIVVGHCDTYPFLDYHRALLAKGAWVEFDTIRGQSEFDTQQQLARLRALLDEGYTDRLLLSQDVCLTRHLSVYGGNGYSFVVTEFKQRMLDAGVSEEQAATLLVENPRRMLAGE